MQAKADFILPMSLCLALLTGSVCAAEEGGRLCINAIPIGERWDANNTGAKESSSFTVQIDKQAPIVVTTNVAGVFTDLSLTGEHTVSIRLDRKPLTSLRFS